MRMSPCDWVCVKGWFLVCIFSHCAHPTVSRQQLIILISVFDQRDIDGSSALYSYDIFHFLLFMRQYPGNVLQIQWLSVCAFECFSSTSLSFVFVIYWSKSWDVLAHVCMFIHVFVIPLREFLSVMGSVCATLFPVQTSPRKFPY